MADRARSQARGVQRPANVARFPPGRNGALYDYSNVASLNQLSTGTTPVTAVTQPVGLSLDSRLGLALGVELVTNGTFNIDTNGWVSGASFTSTATATGGEMQVTATVAFGRQVLSFTTVIGKTYLVSGLTRRVSGTGNIYLAVAKSGEGDDVVSGTTSSSSFVSASLIFTATGTTSKVACCCGTIGDVGGFDNISVKLLEGNHALQVTAAARPTWQVDAQGFYYLSFLGTDDCLTSATGGGGSAGFFWCGAVQPTGGAGTFRILWNDIGTNTGYVVQLNTANKLSFVAGNGAAFASKESTATVDVGTKYLLTVWDDGTNLNVQINSAAVETVARPVIVAGTAGFTRFKNNGAASNYFIGYAYAEVYWKNTAGTAAERAAAQAYVKGQAGL